MTTPNHGLFGTIFAIAGTIGVFGINPITIVLAIILGIWFSYHSQLPDLYGILGGTPKTWDTYTRAHRGDLREKHKGDPLYDIHIWLDSLVHDPVVGGWTILGYILEVVLDILYIGSLIIMVGLWATIGSILGHLVFLGIWKWNYLWIQEKFYPSLR